jgi:hypothetical protein
MDGCRYRLMPVVPEDVHGRVLLPNQCHPPTHYPSPTYPSLSPISPSFPLSLVAFMIVLTPSFMFHVITGAYVSSGKALS